jgi:hypothetical protein
MTHPFRTHRDDAMTRRCNECEHIVRLCICNAESIQKVWRTLSENKNSSGGFFVWDVIEYMGEKPSDVTMNQFTVAADGTYFMASCYHFFTKEKAEEFLNNNRAPWTNLIIVEGKSPQGHPSFKRGDWVKAKKDEYLDEMIGVIEDVEPCGYRDCDRWKLTFDVRGRGVRVYYHTDRFVKMTPEEILKIY